ncbi:hypothetical protein GCM10022202_07290 [Microbacterium marinilacus]|uniref:Uncharacterized protein n=1 Tax=Microbacterium marinilacus TaxID=415209 RepID=A0ABP7B5P4_9MICO
MLRRPVSRIAATTRPARPDAGNRAESRCVPRARGPLRADGSPGAASAAPGADGPRAASGTAVTETDA